MHAGPIPPGDRGHAGKHGHAALAFTPLGHSYTSYPRVRGPKAASGKTRPSTDGTRNADLEGRGPGLLQPHYAASRWGVVPHSRVGGAEAFTQLGHFGEGGALQVLGD